MKIIILIITIFIIYFTYKYFKKGKISNKQKKRIKSYGLDKELLERLIEFELERKPSLSRKKAIDWALDRLERDNR